MINFELSWFVSFGGAGMSVDSLIDIHPEACLYVNSASGGGSFENVMKHSRSISN